MDAVCRGVGVEGASRLAVEEQARLLGECGPVALQRREVVGALGSDRPGSVAPAADGVEGEEGRGGGDLVALSLDCSTASWLRTRRWRGARAETRWDGRASPLLVRREVVPSMATISGSRSRRHPTKAVEHSRKSAFGNASITSLSVS